MALDSQQALRIFLVSGLPQAYTYSQAVKRQEEREGQKARDRETGRNGVPAHTVFTPLN